MSGKYQELTAAVLRVLADAGGTLTARAVWEALSERERELAVNVNRLGILLSRLLGARLVARPLGARDGYCLPEKNPVSTALFEVWRLPIKLPQGEPRVVHGRVQSQRQTEWLPVLSPPAWQPPDRSAPMSEIEP